MRIINNIKSNYPSFSLPCNNSKKSMGKNNPPFLKQSAHNISFGSSPEAIIQKTIDKKSGHIVYSNAQKIIDNIDNLLGDKVFSNAIEGGNIKVVNNKLEFPRKTFLGDLLNTIKYPFIDLPRDIAIGTLKFLDKGILKKPAEALLNSKPLLNRMQSANIEKNVDYATDIIETFVSGKGEEFNFEKCSNSFKDKVCKNIATTPRNYKARDERTLNRISTALVSATFSGWDFYNISMLQKDDKNEAKKAQKSRFKQEATRMALSAGMTFISLGALSRYTQNNVIANSLVIALSSLISEVVSRVVNGTPLRPLSPEEAKNRTSTEKDKNEQKSDSKNEKTTFKGNIPENVVFKQFSQKDGTFAPLNKIFQQNAKEVQNDTQPKKGGKLKKILIGGITAASVGFLATKIVRGNYTKEKELKNLLLLNEKNRTQVESYLKGESGIPIELVDKIKNIENDFTQRSNKYDILKKIKEKLTQKKTDVYVSEINTALNDLINSNESAGSKNILKAYQDHAELLLQDGTSQVSAKMDRFLISGLYNGFGKLFKTVYQIFSIPGAIVDSAINSLLFKKSNKLYNGISDKLNAANPQKYKNEMGELSKILFNKKYTKALQNAKTEEETAKIHKKQIDTITKHTRNFTKGSETGELANYSRTMVTAISTYFFVNDYYNKVLIESKGENQQEAKIERNERIAQKIANFIINGTLMNLFNTVFKTPLNNSLPQAAIIAAATEMTNESLVRKSICQPIFPKNSKQEIIDYEESHDNKKGPMGAWTRLFRKLTGKKSLTQKAGIETKNNVDKKDN